VLCFANRSKGRGETMHYQRKNCSSAASQNTNIRAKTQYRQKTQKGFLKKWDRAKERAKESGSQPDGSTFKELPFSALVTLRAQVNSGFQ